MAPFLSQDNLEERHPAGNSLMASAKAWFARNASSAVARYIGGVLVALAMLLLRELLVPYMGDRSPYHTAWLGIVISAWYLGLGPSLLTLAIETTGVWYFFLPPLRSFLFEDSQMAAGLIGFVLLSGLIIALGEANRRGVKRRRQAETELRAYRDQLERTVEARTAELTEANKQLSALSASLMRAQDDERRRIARDLHDSVGQILTAITIDVSLIGNDGERLSPGAAERLKEIASLASEACSEIRTLSHLLHPPMLDEVGLKAALNCYVQGFAERSGIHVDMEQTDMGRLAPEYELVLFRIVQQCLTNIHTHSGGSMAAVRFSHSAAGIILEVTDDGGGMTPERLVQINSGGGGVGIRGMRERLKPLGGKLEVVSSPKGTCVRAVLPQFEEPMHSAANGVDEKSDENSEEEVSSSGPNVNSARAAGSS